MSGESTIQRNEINKIKVFINKTRVFTSTNTSVYHQKTVDY